MIHAIIYKFQFIFVICLILMGVLYLVSLMLFNMVKQDIKKYSNYTLKVKAKHQLEDFKQEFYHKMYLIVVSLSGLELLSVIVLVLR